MVLFFLVRTVENSLCWRKKGEGKYIRRIIRNINISNLTNLNLEYDQSNLFLSDYNGAFGSVKGLC